MKTTKINEAIEMANKHKSRLTPEIHKLDSLSSEKGRHLLNNLTRCVDNTTYLEIGTYKGASFVSAMFGNDNVSKAYVIENWCWPYPACRNNKAIFTKSVEQYVPHIDFDLLEEDATTIDLSLIKHKINYVFYDADHEYKGQYESLVHLAPVFSDMFILVVDDWAQNSVQRGVRDALAKTGIGMVRKWELPGAHPLKNGDLKRWWHGILVAIATKNNRLFL